VRVFIISDMEGVAGIVRFDQVTGGHPMYEEGRRLYTGEINAAVRGAKAAGASEIVVMDCHGAGEGWTFNSLMPEELDPDCEYVVQNQWTEYVEYLERGVDAALFVGMHAMAGTPDGVLAHTVSGSSWWRHPGSPCEILVDYATSDHVEKYRHRPGVEITSSRQIASRAEDWWTAWRQFFF